MKIASTNVAPRVCRRAFTLVELLVATAVGCLLAGAVLFLLCQTATEQVYGFSDMTVEEKAYILQANITTCLRCMSATQGITPNYSTALYDTNGNFLGYQSIIVFYPSNGVYIAGNISYNSSTGEMVYTTNILTPLIQTVWMSNSANASLTKCWFSPSFNLDGSQNNSLVNVCLQMDDNGYSQQTPNNNPASVYRNFSVQMRNDN
ncbi:MAG TPA: prepilin-type N-terminal cleavage/methylation domain-containing protein [Candidatus Baltobacteraceae bacterium]|jgi:prepilin-type N-terminal cleavage/methylation domain-containing protein|nr:prepilin-type N-terminal cleavage/methylation domain-containing protein [Candidatus Baltobacteraceae bacterium]